MPEKRLSIVEGDLNEIRRNADWRQVFTALGIKRDERKSRIDDWWALSPFREETRPSFHMNDKGFNCFSSGICGGVIELVQKVFEARTGREPGCYEAARWLVENGLSRFSGMAGRLAGTPPAAVSEAAGTGTRAAEASCSFASSDSASSSLPVPETPKVAVYGMPEEREKDARKGVGKPLNPPIRQSLLPYLGKEHAELKRRGIAPKTCAYLGCGHLSGGKSPLAGRIVFQVRGVERGQDGKLMPVILTHIGRALTAEQEEAGGKWHMYAGFHKSLEVYNIDKVVLDERAVEQARASGHVLITEGCFDVAKLVEAGILNVAATFGAHLDEDQLPRLRLIAEVTGVRDFLVWYDRDPAGKGGQEKAVVLINASGDLTATGFDWEASLPSPGRGSVKIPETATDPGEFSGEQLYYLRNQRVI